MLTVVNADSSTRGGALLDEIVREGAGRMLEAALEAEVNACIAELAGDRDENGCRLVVRNGYHQPRKVTAAGAIDFDQVAFRPPLSSGVGQVAELFLLLRIDADHRLPGRLVCCDLLVDVAELGVPVGVLSPLKGLGVGLEAEVSCSNSPVADTGSTPTNRKGSRKPSTHSWTAQCVTDSQ